MPFHSEEAFGSASHSSLFLFYILQTPEEQNQYKLCIAAGVRGGAGILVQTELFLSEDVYVGFTMNRGSWEEVVAQWLRLWARVMSSNPRSLNFQLMIFLYVALD